MKVRQLSAEPVMLGIMVVYRHSRRTRRPPFADRGFYRKLSKAGAEYGIRVFVFDPLYVDWASGTVAGYEYLGDSVKWRKIRRPVPAVVYDRCFYSGKSQYMRYSAALRRLERLPVVRYMMRGLSGKWQVQQFLSLSPKLRSYLPDTVVLTRMEQIADWLKYHDACILKPNAGSHGKKIVRIKRVSGKRFEVTGRNSRNEPILASFDSMNQLLGWMKRFIGSKKYLLQQYLNLQTTTGQPFDIRSLVQKGGDGSWQLTGMAVRIGRPGSLTANLHGGGSSIPIQPFMEEQFGKIEGETIMQQLEDLSYGIPEQLERQHHRLVELGVDFGIDQDGKVWILEVNSKPGRSVFARLHDVRTSRASVSNLIDYARYLFDRQLGGLMK